MNDWSGPQSEIVQGFRRLRDGGTVLEAALLVSTLVDRETDAEWCRAEIARLAENATAAAPELVASLRAEGFEGTRAAYNAPRSSALWHVLRERRGIPISLAAVVISVAEEAGMRCSGVNFPGHFLVDVEGVLIDPFAMEVTLQETWAGHLRRQMRASGGGEPTAADLKGALTRVGAAPMAMRMISNLRGIIDVRRDPGFALTLTDCQLALQPGAFGLHVDRADIWLSLRGVAMARQELKRGLRLAKAARIPDEDAERGLRERLAALPDEPDTAH